ncbi:PREDICTED: putative cyclin-D7-1 isoform X2 [Tarenaya hassleriana]|uniref:putative cyclin-D7-1 isoform X2 n=1 Tax=Tarenaya hassleriana TaxID=28532 RepID=UPI00053C61CA|nr:PREDICTED: putative cyclin-D7-1 isoform X2 [Tarenaya hassleriana]
MKPHRNLDSMENLLCDESWLSPSQALESCGIFHHSSCDNTEAISVDLERELSYTPRDKYVELLVSRDLTHARHRAVQWLVESRIRLNLSFGTVFSAANCLDRFISVSSCNEWKYWMVELLSVACLSTASKFNEVSCPTLQEIQMEGLDHNFRNGTILQMEMILLNALEWHVGTITAHSFSLMIISDIEFSNHFLGDEIKTRVAGHLLEDLSDFKMQEYPPSVVGLSAVWNVLEELSLLPYSPSVVESLERIMNLFGEERKEKVTKCITKVKSRQMEQSLSGNRTASGLESPVTVLPRDQKNIDGAISDGLFVDLSMFQYESGWKKKRDRECYESGTCPIEKKRSDEALSTLGESTC